MEIRMRRGRGMRCATAVTHAAWVRARVLGVAKSIDRL